MDFTSFPTIVLFCSRIYSRIPPCIYCHVFFFFRPTIPESCFCLAWPWHLRRTGQLLCRMPLNLILCDISLWFCEAYAFKKNTIGGICPSLCTKFKGTCLTTSAVDYCGMCWVSSFYYYFPLVINKYFGRSTLILCRYPVSL